MPEIIPQNIAQSVNEETLKKIGKAVCEDYDIDLRSRAGLDERLKMWFKLFSGQVDKKNHPYKDSANVCIPILAIACHQSHARSFEALIPPKEIAKHEATDDASVEVANRRSKYLNWQLTEQMREWKKDMDKLLLLRTIYGFAVKKTYYDHMLKRPVSRTLRVDEFVAPYGVTDLEDAPRKTHIIKMSINDVKKRGKAGVWINTEDIEQETTSPYNELPAVGYTDMSDKSIGQETGYDDRDAPRIILEQHRLWDLNNDGIEEPYCVTVDKDTEKVLSILNLTYTDNDGIERVHDYFTAYPFIANPDSWMGFGYGHILEHLNRSVNSLTNQLIDAGTLSNIIGGFVNKQRNLRIGKLQIKMGRFTEVDLQTDDIRKSFYEFQFKQPSGVLFSLLEKLQEYSQKVSSTPDSMLGEMPPSDTAATTVLAIMEQSMKLSSTVHRRTHDALKEELRKISVINSIYIDDNIYRKVQNSADIEGLNVSGLADFSQTIDVIPASDPSITSRAEQLIRAKQAYEIGIQNRLIAEKDQSLYELTKEYLRALGVKNIDKILQMPPPPPEPPDLSPDQEEAEFLKEQGVEPLEQQDHEYHLESHIVFRESMKEQPEDALIKLSPQGRKLLDAHIRETMALLYLQQERESARLRDQELRGYEGMAEAPMYGGVQEDIGMGETEFDGGISI